MSLTISRVARDINNKASIEFEDSANIDAFGRLRVSEPYTLFDSKVLYDKAPLFWDESIAGSGTSVWSSGNAAVVLTIPALYSGVVQRQTFRRFNYSPAKSQLIFNTFVMGSGQTNVTKRVGLYDVNNGLFLQQKDNVMSFVYRKNGLDTITAQSEWNIDKMDGSGASQINLDFTKAQIMITDFEWLGTGRIRQGFVVDGAIYYANQVLNANYVTSVYMSTPNLPLRYEILSSATIPVSNSLTQICSSVISEGGREKTGFTFSIDRGATSLATLNNADIYPLVAVRLQSDKIDTSVVVEGLSIICTSSTAYRWMLILNPTIVGTALTYAAVANTSVEASTGNTNATTITGGTVLLSGYSLTTNDGSVTILPPSEIQLGATIAGVADRIFLAIQRLTGAAETFYGGLTLRQQV